MKIHMVFKGVCLNSMFVHTGGGVENTQKSIHMVYGCSPKKALIICIFYILVGSLKGN